MARTIAQRELRNDNAKVIEAVVGGESFIVTRNRVPVAELRPISNARRTWVSKTDLVTMIGRGPRLDAARFRSDVDRVIDPSL